MRGRVPRPARSPAAKALKSAEPFDPERTGVCLVERTATNSPIQPADSPMKNLRLFAPLLLAASVTWIARASDQPLAAIAHLQAAHGSTVAGTIQFTATPQGVHVVAHVTNLAPGQHGFHIHAKGDLSAPDLSSAGGHFNPTNEAHGARDGEHHHVGDLGNLLADASGTAEADFIDPSLSLEGPNSILGHSVIIHGGADDLKSQPAGNSGPRVAGGVIEKQQM